jgi:hypothetical protein
MDNFNYKKYLKNNPLLSEEDSIKEGKRLFHYTIPKNEFGMTRMVIKAKDREEADEKIAAEYPDGGYEYKGKGAKFEY